MTTQWGSGEPFLLRQIRGCGARNHLNHLRSKQWQCRRTWKKVQSRCRYGFAMLKWMLRIAQIEKNAPVVSSLSFATLNIQIQNRVPSNKCVCFASCYLFHNQPLIPCCLLWADIQQPHGLLSLCFLHAHTYLSALG
jgi:hypothetical protein